MECGLLIKSEVLNHAIRLHLSVCETSVSFLAQNSHVTIALGPSNDECELWFRIVCSYISSILICLLSWTEFVLSLDSGAYGLLFDSHITRDDN